jgi:hypothetical protein
MKDWRRMCKAFTTDDDSCCCGCPVVDLHEYGCGAIFEMEDGTDWERYEGQIREWAAEHPEPVYPTWEKYLADLMMLDMMCDKTDNPNSVENYMRKTPIPADIAEKLGIEPKEGV